MSMTEWIRADEEVLSFDDFVSVSEAAQILRVSEVTLRRWIEHGRVRAYRFGPKRIRLRRADLEALVMPAREGRTAVTSSEALRLVPMAISQDDSGVVTRARALQAALLEKRHGKRLPESWKDINEAREQRSTSL